MPGTVEIEGYTECLRSTHEVMGDKGKRRKREREDITVVSAFIQVSARMDRVSKLHSLLVNIKLKSR